MMQSDQTVSDKTSRVDEFVELFAKSQQKLYVYIVSMIFNSTDAYDVLQDTNLALWQRFDDFERGSNFFAWASEVARYRALRYRQHQKTRRETFNDEVLASLAIEVADKDEELQAARLQALTDCLQKLPAKDREIVDGRYSPEATLRALAKQVGRSENALTQALRRIRRVLAECTRQRLSQEGGA